MSPLDIISNFFKGKVINKVYKLFLVWFLTVINWFISLLWFSQFLDLFSNRLKVELEVRSLKFF